MYKEIIAVLTLLFLLIVPSGAQGQSDAGVKRVRAATVRGIVFTVWTEQQVVKSGNDIVVNYKVENYSDQTIYLVRDQTSDNSVVVEADELIIFPAPLVPLGGHEPCDYSYTKIGRSKFYQSRLKVTGDKYPKETQYAEQRWKLRMGFGYVTDIRGLSVSKYDDPLPCKALLNSRLKSLSLDGLIVEMSRP